jgi:hypothetical protein
LVVEEAVVDSVEAVGAVVVVALGANLLTVAELALAVTR